MAERVDWLYHRKKCSGSKNLRGFLSKRGCVLAEEVDAAAQAIDKVAALELLRQAVKLVVARRGEVSVWDLADGKAYKYRYFKPAGKPGGNGYDAPHGAPIEDCGTLWYYILRDGFLRTPTLRKGRTVLVGFSAAAVKRVFRK